MLKITHLSDLHVGQENSIKKCIALFQEANELGHTVVISGDITDNGLEFEYDMAYYLIEQELTDCTVVVAPGNHDYGRLGNILEKSARKRFKKYFGKVINPINEQISAGGEILEYYDEVEKVVYFVLDSADNKGEELFARGRIGHKQLEELKFKLGDWSDTTRVVILHHHPFLRPNIDKPLKVPCYWGLELADSDEFQDIVKNNCEILLFGHRHHEEGWCDKLGIEITHAADKQTLHVVEFDND